MHMADCLIQMDNIPIYPIISFGFILYYIYNPRSSPGLALQAYRNFEKYLMVFFPIFNMIGTCKFDMWTTKRLCIHQYWTKIRQCPVFFNFSLPKEVGTFYQKIKPMQRKTQHVENIPWWITFQFTPEPVILSYMCSYCLQNKGKQAYIASPQNWAVSSQQNACHSVLLSIYYNYVQS